MERSYFSKNLDLCRCSIFDILKISLVHGLMSVLRHNRQPVRPKVHEMVIAFTTHHIPSLFHFGYHMRNLLRKIRAKIFPPKAG